MASILGYKTGNATSSKCWTPNCKQIGTGNQYYEIKGDKSSWFNDTVRKPAKEESLWDIKAIPSTSSSEYSMILSEENSIEEIFVSLAKAWKNETAGYSFLAKKINNINYLGIIGLGVTVGEPVVKLILQDLENGPDFWHFALKNITKENPVDKASVRDIRKIREIWLDWGRKKNII
jgi:hypothetical protein